MPTYEVTEEEYNELNFFVLKTIRTDESGDFWPYWLNATLGIKTFPLREDKFTGLEQYTIRYSENNIIDDKIAKSNYINGEYVKEISLYCPEQKCYYSKPQSTTVYCKKLSHLKFFGFHRNNEKHPVLGICYKNMNHILIQRIILDIGTNNKPYVFGTYEEAEEFYKATHNKKIFDNLKDLYVFLKNNKKISYNELMARLHFWPCDGSASIVIYDPNNQRGRILAQLRALDILNNIRHNAKSQVKTDSSYKVPITIFNIENENNDLYTDEEQEKDLKNVLNNCKLLSSDRIVQEAKIASSLRNHIIYNEDISLPSDTNKQEFLHYIISLNITNFTKHTLISSLGTDDYKIFCTESSNFICNLLLYLYEYRNVDLNEKKLNKCIDFYLKNNPKNIINKLLKCYEIELIKIILHSSFCTVKIIQEKNETGDTLFTIAAKRNHHDILEIILQKYATKEVINTHNNYKQDALSWCIVNNNIISVLSILSSPHCSQQNLIHETSKKNNPIICSVKYNYDFEIFKLIVSNKNFDKSMLLRIDSDKKTVLVYAFESKNINLIQKITNLCNESVNLIYNFCIYLSNNNITINDIQDIIVNIDVKFLYLLYLLHSIVTKQEEEIIKYILYKEQICALQDKTLKAIINILLKNLEITKAVYILAIILNFTKIQSKLLEYMITKFNKINRKMPAIAKEDDSNNEMSDVLRLKKENVMQYQTCFVEKCKFSTNKLTNN